ncbi:MAG: peptidylprolyl isomerase, partial [Microcystaceae cyanobacterium]
MDAKWLKIDDHTFSEQELYPLLAQYQLLPQLAKEILLDQAIADIACSPEEEQQAKERFFQQVQITTPEQFQAWLTQSGMT